MAIGKGLQFGESSGMYHHDVLGWVPVQLVKVSDAPELIRRHLAQEPSPKAADHPTETLSPFSAEVRHFEKFGGDPKRWLSEWMRVRQIGETDRVAFEMRTLVDCLYTAGSYDQLNVPSLASMEIVARRLQ